MRPLDVKWTVASVVRAGYAVAMCAALGCNPGNDAVATSDRASQSALVVRESSSAPVSTAEVVQSRSATQVSAQSLAEWRKTMAAAPSPKTGCFEATHPNTEWVEVPCSTTRHSRPPGRPGLRATAPGVVGGVPKIGPGWTATETSGNLSQVVGSFFNVNVSSENENGTANDFSLQLNTNSNINIPTSLCGTRANCKIGWEQFVYWGGSAEVWYILLGYGTCPSSAWIQPAGTSDCYLEGSNTSAVPAQNITNLGNMTVTGVAGTTNDSVTVTTGDGKLYKATNTSYLNLDNSWTFAEFNVFGNASFAEAMFGANSTLSVALSLTDGATASPSCTLGTTTGETDSLNYVPASCCASSGTSPSLVFTETNLDVNSVNVPFSILNDVTPIMMPLLL
jgi:hypothetical protein